MPKRYGDAQKWLYGTGLRSGGLPKLQYQSMDDNCIPKIQGWFTLSSVIRWYYFAS